ncbi:MAG TPA: Rid family hydrolase [Myxococcaceae bacterium]|nr:Rid family hydrolase [Myxococcaceae bacterium]
MREARRDPKRIERRPAVDGLPAPTGPFSWSVGWGDLVFVSGLRGIDPQRGQPVEGDPERVRLIFEHLGRILAANGSSLRDVLFARVYVTDMTRHRPIVNEAFERVFGAELPARTIVEVRALNQGDSVEMEVVAVRRERPSRG